MKKLSLILVLLLAVGLMAFAGEPSVSGVLGSQLSFDDDADLGNIGKLRLNVEIPVGDYVNVIMDLRNDAWASGSTGDRTYIVDDNGTPDDDSDDIVSANEYADVSMDLPGYFYFNQVYATTDVSGIFGISDMVALTLTMGNFEYWISNWNSPTSTNRARAVEYFAIGGSDASPDAALDIGVGDFGTVKAYIETAAGSDKLGYKFGFVLGPVVDGLNAAVSYSGTDGRAYMKAEAGYTMSFGDGMSLTVPLGFLYNMTDDATPNSEGTFRLGAGVKFAGMGLSAGVGVMLLNDWDDTVDDEDLALSVLDVQLAYAIMDSGVSIYVNMNAAPSEDVNSDFMESLDFGLSYDLEGNMIYVGYVADLGDNATTTYLMMDDSTGRHGIVGDGFYIVSLINF